MTHWPQYAYLAWVFMALGVAIALHGKPSPPRSAWGTMVRSALALWLLTAGGFFEVLP
jgi:hypothetical protein